MKKTENTKPFVPEIEVTAPPQARCFIALEKQTQLTGCGVTEAKALAALQQNLYQVTV
jgi:hypothetical protein